MTRPRIIALATVALLAAFALGFLPTWNRARTAEGELREARVELRWARLEGIAGAALAEASRSNYERARQLMAEFFSRLQPALGGVEDLADRRELEAILAQRDEIITLLSRAEPESTQRLMLIYTRYFAAMDPMGSASPTIATPSPPVTKAP